MPWLGIRHSLGPVYLWNNQAWSVHSVDLSLDVIIVDNGNLFTCWMSGVRAFPGSVGFALNVLFFDDTVAILEASVARYRGVTGRLYMREGIWDLGRA